MFSKINLAPQGLSVWTLCASDPRMSDDIMAHDIRVIVVTHYNDVIMGAMASQITSLKIVYSTAYSRHRSKKTSKLHVTGLCVGTSQVTGESSTQMASNAENVSIWWHHPVGRRVSYISSRWVRGEALQQHQSQEHKTIRNDWQLDCLFNLLKLTRRKTSRLHITGPFVKGI